MKAHSTIDFDQMSLSPASLYDEQKVEYPGPGSYTPIENSRASRKAIPGRSTFGHKDECIKKGEQILAYVTRLQAP